MKPGGWPSILAVYLYGVLGVACLSKMLPLAGDLQRALGASPAQFALLLSMLALPAAVLATVAGALVDRVGPRLVLILSALIGSGVDAGYWFAPSLGAFQVLRLFEGLTMVGIFTAAPALLMATTADRRRVSAMTLWSTYTPTGFSLGLVIAAGFAGGPGWRWTFVLHGGLFLAAAALGLALPRAEPRAANAARKGVGARVAELLGAYAQSGPVRLALAFGLVICLGLGVSTVMPSFLSQVHGLSIGAASNLLAAANFSMILGAFLTSFWLGSGRSAHLFYIGLGVVGSIAGVVLFAPGAPFAVVLAALCVWLMVSGAATSFALAVLPGVIDDPRRGAAAAGLFSQISSVVTLVTPPIWLGVFGHGGWGPFVGLIFGGWILSFLFLPKAATRFRSSPGAAAAVH